MKDKCKPQNFDRCLESLFKREKTFHMLKIGLIEQAVNGKISRKKFRKGLKYINEMGDDLNLFYQMLFSDPWKEYHNQPSQHTSMGFVSCVSDLDLDDYNEEFDNEEENPEEEPDYANELFCKKRNKKSK